MEQAQDQAEIIPGLIRATLADGAIYWYQPYDVRDDVMDCFVEDVNRNLLACGTDRPYLAIYDITRLDELLPMSMQKRSAELSQAHPHVRGRAALLLKRNLMTAAFQFFLRMLRSPHRPKQAFFELDEAKAWLMEELDYSN